MGQADDMVLFERVVREGGFAAAGRALGLRRQSVSERIARLEAQLGVRLLERTPRRLHITQAGARYLQHCVAVAGHVRTADQVARGMQERPVGTLRVSAPVLLGRRHLAQIVAELTRSHPELEVELVLTNRFVELVEEGIDVAIRVGPPGDASFVARRIGTGLVHYVASPSLLGGRPGLDLADLIRRRLTIGARASERWRVGDAIVEVRPRIRVGDLDAQCAAAVAGAGVARLPEFVHQPFVDSGTLVTMLDALPAAMPPMFVVYPSREFLPAKVRIFVDAVVATLSPAFRGDPSAAEPRVEAR